MSTKDYTKLKSLASRLINKYGRAVSLYALKTTPRTTSKPWDGQKGASDPVDTPVDTIGAFVPLQGEELGVSVEFVARFSASSQFCLIPAQSGDVGRFAFLDEPSGQRWNIRQVETLQPGDTVLMHFLELQR